MLQGSLRAMESRIICRRIEIEEEKSCRGLSSWFWGISSLERPDYTVFCTKLIKEIYKTNICLLRKCVVESRILGKADVEEIGGFCYGLLKLWIEK